MAYLLIQRDFTIQVLSGECMKVLNLLVVVGLELSHCSIQHCFAARSYFFILLHVKVKSSEEYRFPRRLTEPSAVAS